MATGDSTVLSKQRSLWCIDSFNLLLSQYSMLLAQHCCFCSQSKFFLIAYYACRLQQLEDRAHCAEANLARAMEDIYQLRYIYVKCCTRTCVPENLKIVLFISMMQSVDSCFTLHSKDTIVIKAIEQFFIICSTIIMSCLTTTTTWMKFRVLFWRLTFAF